MKRIVTIASVCAAALVMSQPASAQQQPGQSGSSRQQSGQQQSGTQQQGTQHVRISKLIGQKVTSQDGKDVGKIEDVAVNPKTGDVDFVMVKKGLTDRKLTPIPWQALTIQPDGKKYTVKLNDQKMQGAPSFDEDQYSQLDSPAYVIEVFEFYSVAPPEGVGGTGSSSQGQQQGTQQRQQQQQQQSPPQQ